jgi:predicted carbohydrate-binding protein with CBM5 and CBM33 domain
MFISKALVFLAAAIISSADGHGYLQTPRSRNFVASQEGKSWDAGPTDPAPEYCPHCLNVVGKKHRI